jgi:hypothetical protein
VTGEDIGIRTGFIDHGSAGLLSSSHLYRSTSRGPTRRPCEFRLRLAARAVTLDPLVRHLPFVPLMAGRNAGGSDFAAKELRQR